MSKCKECGGIGWQFECDPVDERELHTPSVRCPSCGGSGDPNLTATKEEREEWRLSSVRYADKLEQENQRLWERLEEAEELLKRHQQIISNYPNGEHGITLLNDIDSFLSESQKELI